jgi:hypothetical protein
MNANLPSKISIPEVPGIDDCDCLLSCSSRDGLESLYARVQHFTWEDKQLHACALTFDSEASHYCCDFDFPDYGFSLKQVARWLVESAREQWGKGNFVKCTETRKLT